MNGAITNNADALELLRLEQEFRDEAADNTALIVRWLGDNERDLFARLLMAAGGKISSSPRHVYDEIKDIAAENYAKDKISA